MFWSKYEELEQEIYDLDAKVQSLELKLRLQGEEYIDLWRLVHKLDLKLDVLAFDCGFRINDGPHTVPISDSPKKAAR